jgi:hypothetical protein
MDFLKKNFSIIAKSVLNAAGKVSHIRVSSYYILASILFAGIVFAGIEIGNAIVTWNKGGGETYEVPTPHIVIFGMILSHHLVLLGLKKSGEKDVLTNTPPTPPTPPIEEPQPPLPPDGGGQ